MPATPAWILIISWAAKIVLVVLLALSVWSVSILVDRRRRFRATLPDADLDAVREAIRRKDMAALSAWALKGGSLQAESMREVLAAPQKPDAIAYAQKAFLSEKRTELSKGLSNLATLGSNAPFIGLFGTVLGIIEAFGALATSNAAMNQVISALAEALVATAIGLFVAIPAVVAYNYFTQRIRSAVAESESLRDLYLSRTVMAGDR